MTKEEAIHILDNLKPTNTKSSFDAYVVGQAITMAIEALAQEPEIIRCKDCKWYEGDIMANPWGVCCHNGWVVGRSGHEVSENGWCYRAEKMEG